MQGTQFFASSAQPQQPCNHLWDPPDRRSRRIHDEPAMRYSRLLHELPPQVQPPLSSERTRIHTHFVHNCTELYDFNAVLGAHPPPISEEELTLSRTDRVHLSRLRDGNHPGLRSYEKLPRPDTDDRCRWCLGVSETVPHLMEFCRTLAPVRVRCGVESTISLWTSPIESVEYLRTIGLIHL